MPDHLRKEYKRMRDDILEKNRILSRRIERVSEENAKLRIENESLRKEIHLPLPVHRPLPHRKKKKCICVIPNGRHAYYSGGPYYGTDN